MFSLDCSYVNRVYGNEPAVFYVYSKNRWQIAQLLSRILLDSGLRMFWLQLRRDSYKRAKGVSTKDEVKEIKLFDTRTVAIFSTLLIRLLVSCVCVLGEHYTKDLFEREWLSAHWVPTYVVLWYWKLRSRILFTIRKFSQQFNSAIP